MIYVYCPRVSEGATDLVKALRKLGDAKRLWLKDMKGGFLPKKGDTVVCWGNPWHWPVKGVKVVNATKPPDKLAELTALAKGKVPVPLFSHNKKDLKGLDVIIPRCIEHMDGSDLRKPPLKPDFYVEWIPIAEEYRVHIVNGVSVRLGKKFKREEVKKPHPWIRAYDSGWEILYGGTWRKKIPEGIRTVAAKAVMAAGLDFGAVDLGVDEKGKFVVFEVNTSPHLSVYSAKAYAQAFHSAAAQ